MCNPPEVVDSHNKVSSCSYPNNFARKVGANILLPKSAGAELLQALGNSRWVVVI